MGALIAVAAILLLGVNMYVQSKAIQAKIQQELSQRLGTPLHIRRISVTPWGGLKLSGIVIPQVPAVDSSDFLQAKTFQLRIRIFSLFERRLVIREVSLINPDVIWPQNSEGKWRLPGAGEEQAPPKEIATAPPSLPTPSVAESAPSPVESPKIANIKPPKEDSAPSIRTEVQRVNVRHGNFSFLDRAGAMVANFEGVDFRSNVRGPSSIRGNAKVTKISLRDRFFLNRLQSPFNYEPDVLELSKISAEVGSGTIDGHFVMQPGSEDSPFTAEVTFKDVQADQIVSDAGGPKGTIQGKIEGNLEASGKFADPNALVGRGEVHLRDGQVRQYSLLVAIGQLLQIEELTQLHLEQAEAKYHITPGLVTIDQLVLRSPNIHLSATGTINFEGKLKLESQLAINEKVRGQLFKMMRDNFHPADEPGYYALDFHVGGTVERPKTNLMDRMVGHGLKDLVDGFFGSGKPKKKKREAESTPVEEATPSPGPATGEDLSRDAIQRPSPP
ncbi:MAG: AsmA-like C-terminal region-containing protein [Verrucomicrobiota bacterium]